MGRITREMVLAGTDLRQTVEIPQWGEDAEMVIKPITDKQFMEVQAVMFGDVTLGEKDAEPFEGKSMAEIADQEKEVKRMAVAFALSIDGVEWTPENVALLPPGAVDALYRETAIISGFPVGRRSEPTPSLELEEQEEPESPITT